MLRAHSLSPIKMIDQKTIATYFGNDASMLRKFVTVFIGESPLLVNQMDESLYSGDFTALAIQAHTMKGQLKYFGYPELIAKLEEIELLADKKASPDLLELLLSNFNREFEEAYKTLSAIVF